MIDLNQLKAAALSAGGTDWKWWDSNSFRRLTFDNGKYMRDGDALSGCVQRSDGHPDVLMAPGVREFIEMASPANILALINRLPPKCDGNHGGPRCADPECWNDSPTQPTLREALFEIDKRLKACATDGASAHDAYDDFYRGIVNDALAAQPAAGAEPVSVSSPEPAEAVFNEWYESEFRLAGMERGPLDKHAARQAWFAALRATSATPVAQEPVASEIEQMATTRYRAVPDGLLRYRVVAGDGTRALYHGTKDECRIVVRKLTEAFLDGAYAAHVAAQPSVPDEFIRNVKRLCIAARTTGGTTGRDDGLCKAIDRVEAMLAATPPADGQAQQDAVEPMAPLIRDMLTFVLWHHQGGSSQIGQPIRTMLGVRQYDHLTEAQYETARRIQRLIAQQGADKVDEIQRLAKMADAALNQSPSDMRNVLEDLADALTDLSDTPVAAQSDPAMPANRWLTEFGGLMTDYRRAVESGLSTVIEFAHDAIQTHARKRVQLAIEGDARDAARYRYLRDHACNSLHLTRNGDHACNYVTAKEWIERFAPADDFADIDPVEVERMKSTNTIWCLQVYPDTPVGFNVWNGATLDSVVDKAMHQGGQS